MITIKEPSSMIIDSQDSPNHQNTHSAVFSHNTNFILGQGLTEMEREVGVVVLTEGSAKTIKITKFATTKQQQFFYLRWRNNQI